MINRSELKFRAKSVLKENYWMCLAVSAIIGAISQMVLQFTLRANILNGKLNMSELVYSPQKLAVLSTGVAV